MKRSGFAYLFLIFLFYGFLLPQARAADVSITATVDKTSASLEDYILLTVVIEGTRTAPLLSGLDDFQVSSRGKSSQVRIVNGSMSSSYEFNFVLQPLKTGTYTIGPFSVVHKKQTYISDTITLTVSKQAARAAGDDRAVYVTAEVDKQNPYAHEQIIYSFKFYRRVQISEANLSGAPDFEGFVSERLGKEREYRRVINGQTYAVTELRWALFPVESGVLTIGMTTLDCEMVVKERSRRGDRFTNPFLGDSFFGFGARTERKTLRTEPLTVMVHQLPTAGQPDGFRQLVGEFELKGSLGETSVHAGDSATLTLRLQGNGTMRGMKTIDLPLLPNVKVYDDKPVFETNQSPDQAGGTLIVKKAIVPLASGELIIPAVEVPYFHSVEKKYKTARTGPFKLMVLPARQSESLQAVVPVPAAAAKEDVLLLGQDILPIYTGFEVIERTREPRLTALHYVLVAAPVCLYFLFIILYSMWFRRQSDSTRVRARSAWPRFAKQLPMLRSALNENGNDFCGEAARALRDFIGDMFAVTGSALTTAEIKALLTESGKSAQLVEKIERVLEQCDSGRYGIAVNDVSARQDLYKELTQAARELHKSR